jgi:peptidoglycan-associated lipoprotein
MKFFRLFAALFVLTAATLFVTACSSSKAVKRNGQEEAQASQKANTALQQAKKDDLTSEELAQINKVMGELEDVPFDFDKYSIPTEGLDIIKKDVGILNQMLSSRGKYIKTTIEGHTDERGSDEYNLALGDRRAKTVKEYLLAVGFAEQNLQLISYGEERPKEQGHTAEAWAANRRVHLVVE